MDFNPKEMLRIFRKNLEWSNPNSKRLLLGFGTFIVLSSILLVNFFPSRLTGVEVGKPSKQTANAPNNIEFIDNEMTEELRKDASQNVDKAYKYDPVTITRVENNIRSFYNSLREIKSNEAITAEAQLEMIQKKFGKVFSETLLETALIESAESSNRIEGVTVDDARLKPLVIGKARPRWNE